MYRAIISGRAALAGARKAVISQRGLAETTTPRPAVAALKVDSKQELAPSGPPKFMVMDGNEAAAYIAYSMSDISFIYPISPATSMGEHMDKWAATGK